MSERALPVPGTRYESFSHAELKAQVEAGNDPAVAGEIGREWAAMAGRLHDAQEALASISSGSEEQWRGGGGEALRAALDRAAGWSGDSATLSERLGDAIAQQAAISAKARADMPDPVPYDPAAMIRDASAGGDLRQLAELAVAMSTRREESEVARQRAIDVLYARDAALRAAVPAEPAFGTPPSLTAGPEVS